MHKLLILIVLLTGCSTSTKIFGPSGEPMVYIECPDLHQCFEQAKVSCSGGYYLMDKMLMSKYTATATKTSFIASNNARNGIIIKCK